MSFLSTVCSRPRRPFSLRWNGGDQPTGLGNRWAREFVPSPRARHTARRFEDRSMRPSRLVAPSREFFRAEGLDVTS